MLDSTSGERQAAFVTGKGGRRWFSGFNAFKKWGDIEAALRSWAKNFRERLDEARGSQRLTIALAKINGCSQELIASAPLFSRVGTSELGITIFGMTKLSVWSGREEL
jgi:hypothetical protein